MLLAGRCTGEAVEIARSTKSASLSLTANQGRGRTDATVGVRGKEGEEDGVRSDWQCVGHSQCAHMKNTVKGSKRTLIKAIVLERSK